MKPAIVMPFHDPSGRLLDQLESMEPALRSLYTRVVAGVTAPTICAQPDKVKMLEGDPFYLPIFIPEGLQVGDQFRRLFRLAAEQSPAEQALHLCFLDRLAFILNSALRYPFLADMQSMGEQAGPMLFERSAAAWSTHPRNYYELEHMATRAGELLLGRSLDFGWCHLVVSAKRLREILPGVKRTNLSMMAEMILPMQAEITTKAVDWLAWEDPWLLGVDAETLKAERESDPEETIKRLSYVAPTLDVLYAWGKAR